MLKLSIFCAAVLALGATDIVRMRRENLKREMIPYVIIAAAAVVLFMEVA